MAQQERRTTATSWQLESLEVTPTGLDPVKIPPQHLETLTLCEGLSFPTLRGTITLKDYNGVIDVQEIFTGDDIAFSIKSIGETSELTFRGKIVSSTFVRAKDNTIPVNVLHFCTDWWYEAMTRQISMAWRNASPEAIIGDLIAECGGSFQGVYPTPDFEFDRFVSPFWTPAHTIKHVLDYCGGEGQSGYHLYDTLIDQYPIAITGDYLRDGNWGEYPNELHFGTQNPNYAGNVNTYYVEQYFDEMRYLNQGLYQTDWWSFDFDRNKSYKSEGVIDDAVQVHLAAIAPLRNDSLNVKYRSVRQSRRWPNTEKRIEAESDAQYLADLQRDTRYNRLVGDLVKINCMIQGDTSRSAGQLIKCNFPAFNANDKDERNSILEGKYLIRDVKHIFTATDYAQAMTLVSDGFSIMKRTDMKRW